MYFLIDAGGTESKIVLSEDGLKFNGPKIINTPKKFEEAMAVYKNIAQELSSGRALKSASMGVAGHFDKEKTKILNAPNLPDWNGKPLKEEMQKALNAPVYLENDTALVGLGEAVYGAGRGYKIVAYVTVSTGVNGVRIVNGAIDKSAYGFEIGHQFAGSTEGRQPQNLEDIISGSAVEKHFNRKPYEITDEKIWSKLAEALAYGLNNTILHWSPEVVVLGGSMMGEKGISLEETEKYLRNILKIFGALPDIKKASLDKTGGLYGGLEIIKQISGMII